MALDLREKAPPKSGMGKACGYLLKCWEPLNRTFPCGETRLDTNLVENAIRPPQLSSES
jgi:hypothetical protein